MMSVFFYKVSLLCFLSYSVIAGAAANIEGKLQHSFDDREYIFYDENSVRVIDRDLLDDYVRQYLDRNVNSGKKISLRLDSVVIKNSWSLADRLMSNVNAEKKDELLLSNGRLIFSGTKLFSWREDYFLIQINDKFYQILTFGLTELQNNMLRFSRVGEKLKLVVDSGSLVELNFLSQDKMTENTRDDYILILIDKVYIVGKTLWLGSDSLACVESKGKYFIFDIRSVDSEYISLLRMNNANVSIDIDIESVLAVFDQKGLIRKSEFFSEKEKAMLMRVR